LGQSGKSKKIIKNKTFAVGEALVPILFYPLANKTKNQLLLPKTLTHHLGQSGKAKKIIKNKAFAVGAIQKKKRGMRNKSLAPLRFLLLITQQ
jgi:hypothetical protein